MWFLNEDVCKCLIFDMVVMVFLIGCVIICLIFVGVVLLYGICIIIWGILMFGNFLSGNNWEVVILKISNEIKIM